MPQIPSSVLKAMGKPGKKGMMDLIDAMNTAGMLKRATSVVEKYTPESSFMRGRSRIIPFENAEGQTGMFGYGRFSGEATRRSAGPVNTGFMGRPQAKATGVPPMPPPFGGAKKVRPGMDVRATVKGAARREELAQKRKRRKG